MQRLRREEKKNPTKNQTTPPRSPLIKIVQISELCQRNWKKNKNKKVVWNSPSKNGVAVEMSAAFATNDSILIYALVFPQLPSLLYSSCRGPEWKS